jgi:reactive intermediate/imine deaminase
MKHRLSVMAVVVTALVAFLGRETALTAPAENRSYVRPSLPGADGPPFSGAVKVGNTLYLSGDIGLTEDQKVPGDAKAEARLLLERVKRTLAEAGFTMEDLVTVTVFCSDVKHYADWNEVYRGYFKQEFPARAFIGSGRLLFDARFEMQGIAVKR